MTAERQPFIKRIVEKGSEISQELDKIFLIAGAGFYIIGAGGIAAILIGGTIITYPIAEATKRWARKGK